MNFDDWITLSDVKHGDIHLCCDWKIAKAAGEDSTENIPKTFYIVSIFIDRCYGLVGGKSRATSLYPKCKLRLAGQKSDEAFSTLPRNKTENPVFEEGFLLISKQPNKDKLFIEVIDVKGIDTVLGTITIPIEYLITSLHQEFINKAWSLEGGHPGAKINISSKLFNV